MTPAPKRPRAKSKPAPRDKAVSKAPVSPSEAPIAAHVATIAKPVDYVVPRPNLLDTGLSDYSFWFAYVEGLAPDPLPPGARAGRIWA